MRFGPVIACAAFAPFLMAAAQPVRLKPAGPWNLVYAEDSCRLIRNFGEGKTLTKLAFEGAAPGQMDMLVTGRPLATSQSEVSARLLPVDSKSFDGMVAETVHDSEPAIVWSRVPLFPPAIAEQEEREAKLLGRRPGVRPPPVSVAEKSLRRAQRQQFAAATTELEIEPRRHRLVILETGSLGEPIAAFDKCTRESLSDWGVDTELEEKIVRPAWPVNPTRWLSDADYPAAMIARRKESDVVVRLLVDASGKVTKCTSISHFAEKEFNRITCERITERARFEPAELADGTKVPSYHAQRVMFRLMPPARPPQ
jgi:TonB family protein